MPIERIFLSGQPFDAARPDAWTQRGVWPARWIAIEAQIPFVAAYKLPFSLAQTSRFRLHISADERYEFYLDGELVGRGPERGDAENWAFESFDVELEAGEHLLSARVWSLSDKAPFAQISVRHGFLLGAESLGGDQIELDTGVTPWLGKVLGGTQWHSPLCAWGTGWKETIRAADFSWNWHNGAGDDWTTPNVGPPGARAGSQVEIGSYHRLRPASLPPMLDEARNVGIVRHVSAFESRPIGARPIRESDNLAAEINGWQSLIGAAKTLTIAPHTKRRVIIDLENYYCARPELRASGGQGARLDVHWSEGLYDDLEKWSKGNRDEIEGKWFFGVRDREHDGPGDTFYPDGGDAREFRTLWWQAGRYVQIAVETADEPLQIELFRIRETRYPLENQSKFAASDEQLGEVVPLMVRALQMCAHETYMDCPFYEQLMYVGDTRLQILATYAATSDDRLPRRALQLFDWSRLNSGLTQSRYPCQKRQIIPPFSLWWVAMVHDYALWRGDATFIKTLLPGVRAVCDYFAGLIGPDGLMRAPDGWNFTDWVKTTDEQLKYYGGDPKWKRGVPPTGAWEISGVLNWHAALVFRLAGEVENWFGEPEIGQLQTRRARDVAAATDRQFWDEARGLYADDNARENWSEHAQCLAILSGLAPAEKIERLKNGLLNDTDLARTTIYFSHYLFEALRELKQPDAILQRLQDWKILIADGLKTTIEMPEPTRSDCHAWGAHPLFHFHATLAGIRPAAPGFGAVEIKPQLGSLSWLEAEMPHPKGTIRVQVRDGVETVELPDGLARV